MYVFANWKMYLDYDESCILAHQLLTKEVPSNMAVAVFPNMIAVSEVENILRDSTYDIGGQNCSWVAKGAYTGAVSGPLLKNAGCTYVLVGHSERRHIFGENDDDVRKKIEAAMDAGLVPVLCVGETKEDRDEDKAEYRIKKQLMKALDGLAIDGNRMVVAYEPVWAISHGGVGEACAPETAEEMHRLIATEIKQYTDRDIPVIYGGSVDSDNVLSYASLDAVDGVLVGHASTSAEELHKIISNAAKAA